MKNYESIVEWCDGHILSGLYGAKIKNGLLNKGILWC